MLPGEQVVAGSAAAAAAGADPLGETDGRGEADAAAPVDEGADGEAAEAAVAPGAGGPAAGLPAATGCSAAVGVTESGPPPRNSSTSMSRATTATTARTDTRRRQKTWACGSDGYLSSSHNIVRAMLGPTAPRTWHRELGVAHNRVAGRPAAVAVLVRRGSPGLALATAGGRTVGGAGQRGHAAADPGAAGAAGLRAVVVTMAEPGASRRRGVRRGDPGLGSPGLPPTGPAAARCRHRDRGGARRSRSDRARAPAGPPGGGQLHGASRRRLR